MSKLYRMSKDTRSSRKKLARGGQVQQPSRECTGVPGDETNTDTGTARLFNGLSYDKKLGFARNRGKATVVRPERTDLPEVTLDSRLWLL